MKMKEFAASLEGLYLNAQTLELKPQDKIVFISDMHLGDGSGNDDSLPTSTLVERALGEFYLPSKFSLVLNGDIEELQKFSYADIIKAHPETYRRFDEFHAAGHLYKIVGNHDLGILIEKSATYPLCHAIRFKHSQGDFLAYHGHQASSFFVRHNYLSQFIVRYLAQPLKIKNPSVPMTSKRRFKAERRVYRASLGLGIASITGHTHRPLFESMSRRDFLRFSLENLIAKQAERPTQELRDEISRYAKELRRILRKRRQERPSSLYDADGVLVPCLFNSGCAVSKKGFTALEIESDAISLVFWELRSDDGTRPAKAGADFDGPVLSRSELGSGNDKPRLIRSVLRRETLPTVFNKIKLLAP
jgi:hypothetical protein